MERVLLYRRAILIDQSRGLLAKTVCIMFYYIVCYNRRKTVGSDMPYDSQRPDDAPASVNKYGYLAIVLKSGAVFR